VPSLTMRSRSCASAMPLPPLFLARKHKSSIVPVAGPDASSCTASAGAGRNERERERERERSLIAYREALICRGDFFPLMQQDLKFVSCLA